MSDKMFMCSDCDTEYNTSDEAVFCCQEDTEEESYEDIARQENNDITSQERHTL